MKIINLSMILLVVFTFAKCRKTSIKQDPEFPDLPIYSEKGLNVGGVLINGNPWLTLDHRLLSRDRPLQLFSYPSGDSIVILLNGMYKDISLQNMSPKTIFVVIKSIKIITDNDLTQLSGKNYVLDGIINYGGFSEYYGDNKVGKAVGSITFGKVSQIDNFTYGNGSPNNPVIHPYIVAGRLDMNLSTNLNYFLTKGRFDVNIVRNSNQFVVYQ